MVRPAWRAGAVALALVLPALPLHAGCPTELVQNGDFENGTTNWTLGGSSNGVFTTASGDGVCGSSFAVVTQNNGATGTYYFYQDAAIPAGATSATFSFRYRVVSGGFCSGSGTVLSQAYIRDLSNNVLATVLASGCCSMPICDGGPTCVTWIVVSYNAVAFAGQTVRLWLQLYDTNGTPCVAAGNWDCISVQVCIPSPTPSRTPSETATPSRTATPTGTRTGTATAAPGTPTSSASASATASGTRTGSATASRTGTRTATALPTVSQTATETATATAMGPPTVTGTATATAVAPPSATQSASAAATSSPTRTRTATASPTESRTDTAVAPPDSATATATGTAASTLVSSATGTPTPCSTGSLTPTGTPGGTETPTAGSTSAPPPAGSPTPGAFAVYPNPARLGSAIHFAGMRSGSRISVWNLRGERVDPGTLEADATGSAVWNPGAAARGIVVFRVRLGGATVTAGTMALLR